MHSASGYLPKSYDPYPYLQGNEIADKLTRSGSVQRFVGPEHFLGVSRRNLRRKMKYRMQKQHLTL